MGSASLAREVACGDHPRVNPPDSSPATPPPAEPSDLGFGRVVSQQVRGRFLSHDGVPTSRKYGLGAQRTSRFFLNALNVPWPAFIAWLLGILLLINGTFALAYLALGDASLQGATGTQLDDPFLRALSFSVGVFTTTGTGVAVTTTGPQTYFGLPTIGFVLAGSQYKTGNPQQNYASSYGLRFQRTITGAVQ